MLTKTLPWLAVLALSLTSCGGDGSITIEEAWGRPSPAMAEAAAFYMQLDNSTEADTTLVAATADPCGTVELHMSSMNDDGVMSMTRMEAGIAVPADSTVMLEPGGLHIMCIGLDHELETGELIEVQLEFVNTDAQTVEVEIREE